MRGAAKGSRSSVGYGLCCGHATDPEIPLNIVDPGLVYEVQVAKGCAHIKMTLTSPGCHLGGQISGSVQERLLSLDDVEEASIELLWDPPWHQSMISAEGRRKLRLDVV